MVRTVWLEELESSIEWKYSCILIWFCCAWVDSSWLFKLTYPLRTRCFSPLDVSFSLNQNEKLPARRHQSSLLLSSFSKWRRKLQNEITSLAPRITRCSFTAHVAWGRGYSISIYWLYGYMPRFKVWSSDNPV